MIKLCQQVLWWHWGRGLSIWRNGVVQLCAQCLTATLRRTNWRHGLRFGVTWMSRTSARATGNIRCEGWRVGCVIIESANVRCDTMSARAGCWERRAPQNHGTRAPLVRARRFPARRRRRRRRRRWLLSLIIRIMFARTLPAWTNEGWLRTHSVYISPTLRRATLPMRPISFRNITVTKCEWNVEETEQQDDLLFELCVDKWQTRI